MTQEIQLKQEVDELATFIEQIRTTPVQTQEQLTYFTDTACQAKARAKEIEALEKTATEPMNKALKAVRAIFAPAKDAYKRLDAVLKLKIQEGALFLEAEQSRKLAEVTQLAAAGDNVAATAALAQLDEAPEHRGASFRVNVRFEVVDPYAVPADYWCINETALGAAVKAGARDIPGVRIWEEKSVVVRASK